MSGSLVNQIAKNQQIFLTILQNTQFLARQGLAFRGNEDQGNEDQLIKLEPEEVILVPKAGLKKKRGKYLHNETLKLMAFTILRDIAKNINNNVFSQ